MNCPAQTKGKVATPAGFEPATIRLEGECSIQLSYGAIFAVLTLLIIY